MTYITYCESSGHNKNKPNSISLALIDKTIYKTMTYIRLKVRFAISVVLPACPQLLDCYMEAYQHVYDRDEKRQLAQVITNIIIL